MPAGTCPTVSVTGAGRHFDLQDGCLALTAGTLSRSTGVDCAGLLGADVLGAFDFLLDVPGGTVEISEDELRHEETSIHHESFMGIPLVPVLVRGAEHRMFLDTGAQISYFQHESRESFPEAGPVEDFSPGFGPFETDTRHVEVALAGIDFRLRCGELPDLIAATLALAGTTGIVGNEIFRDRPAGYFPRRRLLVL